MHVNNVQVKNMWDRYTRELASFGAELVIHHIVNKNDKDSTRLPLYKENLEGFASVQRKLGRFVRWELGWEQHHR
jgi:hypothetical protein